MMYYAIPGIVGVHTEVPSGVVSVLGASDLQRITNMGEALTTIGDTVDAKAITLSGIYA